MLLRNFHLLILYITSTNPLLKFYYLEQMGYSAKDYGARGLLDIPTLGIKHSQGGNKTFPAWEQSIPKLGMYSLMVLRS